MIGIICVIILDSLLIFLLLKRNRDYPFGKEDYAVMIVVAAIALFISGNLNGFFEKTLDRIFVNKYYYVDGVAYWNSGRYEIIYYLIQFFLVAVVEETTKHIILFTQLRRKKVRTYLDCIISFLLVSALFSIVEDISYFRLYGSATSQLRFVTEISGHLMFSMFVGECYYKYMVNKKIVILHSYLQDKGAVGKDGVIKPHFISIFLCGFSIAILLHWLYNFLVTMYPTLGWICIAIYGVVFCFRYKNALKNKFISTRVVEKYAKIQSDVSKEDIYKLLLNYDSNS